MSHPALSHIQECSGTLYRRFRSEKNLNEIQNKRSTDAFQAQSQDDFMKSYTGEPHTAWGLTKLPLSKHIHVLYEFFHARALSQSFHTHELHPTALEKTPKADTLFRFSPDVQTGHIQGQAFIFNQCVCVSLSSSGTWSLSCTCSFKGNIPYSWRCIRHLRTPRWSKKNTYN